MTSTQAVRSFVTGGKNFLRPRVVRVLKCKLGRANFSSQTIHHDQRRPSMGHVSVKILTPLHLCRVQFTSEKPTRPATSTRSWTGTRTQGWQLGSFLEGAFSCRLFRSASPATNQQYLVLYMYVSAVLLYIDISMRDWLDSQ